MKKKSLAVAFAAIIFIATQIISCSQNNHQNSNGEKNNVQAFTKEQADHGRYLVTIMGCNDCHTPLKMGPMGPEPDMDYFLGGHPARFPMPVVDTNAIKNWVLFTHTNTAIAGPWGISYAANITSDPTGIGNWTLARFKKALKEGKYMGIDNTRPLLPPMPWRNYANIKDEDIGDIFAFLKSTKPIHNIVPLAETINPAK